MPAKLIKGKEVGDKVCADISAELKDLYPKTDKVPGLGIIVVGEDPASLSSVRHKEKQSKKLGFYSEVHRLPATASTEDVCAVIQQINENNQIHGLLCQLPLPENLHEKAILKAIDPGKDVGGMHPINAGKLFSGKRGYLPCSAYGLMQVIDFTKQPIYGKTAVMISRSDIVSKSLALLLLRRDASITFCPTLSGDLPEICRTADILVTDAGKPGLVRGDWIKPGAVVIDASVTRSGEKLVGDVVLEEAVKVAGWISTLPAGGDDPLTITMLMKNTLEAFKKRIMM